MLFCRVLLLFFRFTSGSPTHEQSKSMDGMPYPTLMYATGPNSDTFTVEDGKVSLTIYYIIM